MKINVTENKVSIKEEQILNENEYNIHKIQFDFSSEYTDDLVKVALFSIDNHTYKKIISNNECDIPPEVLTQRGYSILGVYAYKTEQDTLVLRYSPSPTRISVYDGSYKAEAENSEPITPSEIEQYQQILQNSLQNFQNEFNTLAQNTETSITEIEEELQRKVDEGYFDGEDGFSPIVNVIQLSNGAKIEIEDKTGRTSASVFNGYSPQRGVDYWTQEDKEEVIEEATQEIDGKIEEYNYNATEKLNQYNQNSVQKTNDYNTNAEQKMSAYNTNATEKFDDYNSNAEQKEINYNTNANQKVEAFNTNANSKLSEYNSNAETKKTVYDENATQKTNSFNTNATNKLTEYNTNHTEKMSAYNSNSIQKINAFNENATQKTEDFDEHTEEIQDNIEKLQTENARLKATLPTTTGEGQDITLNKTAELEFVKPPLPMGNSEQVQYSGKNLAGPIQGNITSAGITIQATDNSISINGTATDDSTFQLVGETITRPSKYFQGIVLNEQNSIKISAGTYILSSNETGLLKFYGNLGDNLGSCTSITSGTAFTITEDKYVWFGIYIGSGVAINKTIDNLQLEQGSTATSYEPYVGGTASPNPDYPQEITNVTGDVEVVVENKNLLPLIDGEITVNGVTLKIVNGKIKLNGTASATTWISVLPSIKSGTTTDNQTPLFNSQDMNYTVSIQNIEGQISNASNFYFTMLINENQQSIDIMNRTSSTIDFTNKNLYAIWFLINNGTTFNNYEFNAQIEEGSTATSYIQHQDQTFTFPLGNIELCKIGDYQDYFYKESNKWYLHKEIEKVVLDGSESIYVNGVSTTNTQMFLVSINGIITNVGKGILSDKFKTNINIWAYDEEGIRGNSLYTTNTCWIRINKNRLTDNTVKSFKVWLSSNNIIVYYVLATPTDTEITDTTLISQLEAINNALSYEGQTNISSNQNAIFNVEAYQSTKLILESIDSRLTLVEG